MSLRTVLKKAERHLIIAPKAKRLAKRKQPIRRPRTTSELINAESELGRTIFGPIPPGHHREFFHHQKNVWIWHETWIEYGHKHSATVRYEVRPSGVFKRSVHDQHNSGYTPVRGRELHNFRTATHAYLKLIKEKLYN